MLQNCASHGPNLGLSAPIRLSGSLNLNLCAPKKWSPGLPLQGRLPKVRLGLLLALSRTFRLKRHRDAFPLYASSRVHAPKGFNSLTLTSEFFHQRQSAKHVFTSSSSVAASVSASNAPSYTPEHTAFVPPVFPVISSSTKRQRKWKWQRGHQLAFEAAFCCRQHSSSTARW